MDAGEVSADLFRTDHGGRRDYVASLRAGAAPSGVGANPIELEACDEYDRVARAHLSVDAHARATLTVDAAIEGLPFGAANPMTFPLVPKSATATRALEIALAVQDKCALPPSVTVAGTPTPFDEALRTPFRDARLDVAVTCSQLGAGPADGWTQVDLFRLVKQQQQTWAQAREWKSHVLVLSRSTRKGLLGVALDSGRALPRQGALIFANEVAEQAKQNQRDVATSLLHTLVHEVGHTLNLVHPFERQVGRGTSQSAMTYDWIHDQAGGSLDYWSATAQGPRFDDVEARFLRHAPRPAVIPGGQPFHSADYWSREPRASASYRSESPAAGPSRLMLLPPQAGHSLLLGQPVLLGVGLDGIDRPLPSWILDPKAGLLEVRVARLSEVGRRTTAEGAFRPVVRRCFAFADPEAKPGSMRDNLNLTFGIDGFPFSEPGLYALTAILQLPTRYQVQEPALVSAPLLLNVIPPATRDEKRLVERLFTDGVGLFWTLGGYADAATATTIDELLDRLAPGRGPIRHPLAANAARCLAIDAGRDYTPIGEQRMGRTPDLERAAALVGRLDEQSRRCWDPVTDGYTRDLSRKQRARQLDEGARRLQIVVPGQRLAGAKHTQALAGWTVLVYMAADAGKLQGPSDDDLKELRRVAGDDERIRVLVQIDTLDHVGSRVLELKPKGEVEMLRLPESSSGDWRTLRDFIVFGMARYPARHTLLVLWGHASGVAARFEDPAVTLASFGTADFGPDATSEDALTTWELRQALVSALADVEEARRKAQPDSQVTGWLEPRIDLLGFDACHMGSLEIAYQLHGAVNYMVAPQTSIPLAGWHYDRLLEEIRRRPDIAPDELGRRVVDWVGRTPGSPTGLALLNLAAFDGPCDAGGNDFADTMRHLVLALRRAAGDNGEWLRVRRAFQRAAWSGVRQFLDAVDLCRALINESRDSRVQAAARDVLERLQSDHPLVVYQRTATGEPLLGGVSLYCPWFGVTYEELAADARNVEVDEPVYENTDFCLDTDWADFVLRPRGIPYTQQRLVVWPAYGNGVRPAAATPGLALAGGVYVAGVKLAALKGPKLDPLKGDPGEEPKLEPLKRG